MAKLPARKFRGYKCVGAVALAAAAEGKAGIEVEQIETRSEDEKGNARVEETKLG